MPSDRCKVLYLGTDPLHFVSPIAGADIVHCPLIETHFAAVQDVQAAYAHLTSSTHLLFTSKNAVAAFFFHLSELQLGIPKDKTAVCIGKVTALHLKARGIEPTYVATEETQEGVMALLEQMDLAKSRFFIPKSSLSRRTLFGWLEEKGICYRAVDAYHTKTKWPSPLPAIDEMALIVFTSPSTVRAFLEVFGCLPSPHKTHCIGPITHKEWLWQTKALDYSASAYTATN